MLIDRSHLTHYICGSVFAFALICVTLICYRSVVYNRSYAVSEVSQKPIVSDSRHTLGIGSVGPDVVEVHDLLHELGLSCAQDLVTNDLYSERSQACVAQFQLSRHLVPNGVVGDLEWELLVQEQVKTNDLDDAQRWLIPSGNGERNDQIYYPPNTQKFTYLTFNGIADDAYTKELTEFMRVNAVPATFFLDREQLSSYKHVSTVLSNDLFSVGHLVKRSQYDRENHITSNVYDAVLTMREMVKKSDPSKNLLCVRPSYDMLFSEKQYAIQNTGMPYIRWHIDPHNWLRSPPDIVADHIIDHVQPGEIILITIDNADREQTLRVVEKVIRVLHANDWTFEALQC